jgi:hypothetical protein
MKKYLLSLTIVFTLFYTSCNSEGSGIFFQVSQEVKQITSEISELPVHQVVVVGASVYARTGRKIWVQSGATWIDVSKGNYIYNIVEYSGTLYGNINNDDSNLDDGKIMSFDGTSWSLEDEYTSDLTLFEADGRYILIKTAASVNSTFSSADPSVAIVTDESITELILDGSSSVGIGEDLLISDSTIFGTSFGGLVSPTIPPVAFDVAVSGDFCAIANDATNFFLTTTSGQIYKGTVGGGFTLEGTISTDIPSNGSLEVDSFGGTDYLIIGTNNGYYEMNISTSTISSPSATTSVPDFSTSYPELATVLVYEVYPLATAEVFYLATSKGLWIHNADGTFDKQ